MIISNYLKYPFLFIISASIFLGLRLLFLNLTNNNIAEHEITEVRPWHTITNFPNHAQNFKFTKSLKDSSLFGMDSVLVKLKGYYHPSEIRIESSKDGMKGYSIIKPFLFLKEKIPLGWPRWFAYESILVNVGWIPENATNINLDSMTFNALREPIELIGLNVNPIPQTPISTNPHIAFQINHYDIPLLWSFIDYQIRNQKLDPVGRNQLPILIEQVK